MKPPDSTLRYPIGGSALLFTAQYRTIQGNVRKYSCPKRESTMWSPYTGTIRLNVRCLTSALPSNHLSNIEFPSGCFSFAVIIILCSIIWQRSEALINGTGFSSCNIHPEINLILPHNRVYNCDALHQLL